MKSFKKVLSLVLSLALVATLGGVSNLKTAQAEDVDTTAYLMFADLSYTSQYWYDGAEYAPVVNTNAKVTGSGEYTVGLDFTNTASGAAVGVQFAAVGISNAETVFGSKTTIEIKSVKLNGEEIGLVAPGYTCSDDGVTTRFNLYNEWVKPLTGVTADAIPSARTYDGKFTEDTTPIPMAIDATEEIKTLEVTFQFTVPVTPSSPSPSSSVSPTPTTPTNSTTVKKGTTFTSGNFKYKVTTANKQVAVVGLKAAAKKKTSLTVPASVKKNGKTLKVTAINANAFKGASKLKTVTIGKNVTTIKAKAFNGNKKLATVKTKGKLKTVKKNAFKGVTKKLKVTGTSAKANKKLIKKSGAKVK